MLKVIPTAVGLGSIPLIIHPIDHSVEYGMDRWVRPFLLSGRERLLKALTAQASK